MSRSEIACFSVYTCSVWDSVTYASTLSVVWLPATAQVLKVIAKKLLRKALEMLRKLAAEEPEDEEGEVCINASHVSTDVASSVYRVCF